MPNIIIRIPEGVLDAGAKAELVRGINDAAARAEQIADNPQSRAMCWVVIDEIKAGNWTCGAADPASTVVPVIVQTFLPAGVFDAQAGRQYAEAVQGAMAGALRGERRKLVLSAFVTEVPDGQWAINGRPWRLPDFARHAGYAHLRHLAAT
ncbi:MAG TPA: tautomerase [Telluria sp.]|nr:tautomerase [Telluria sp.]